MRKSSLRFVASVAVLGLVGALPGQTRTAEAVDANVTVQATVVVPITFDSGSSRLTLDLGTVLQGTTKAISPGALGAIVIFSGTAGAPASVSVTTSGNNKIVSLSDGTNAFDATISATWNDGGTLTVITVDGAALSAVFNGDGNIKIFVGASVSPPAGQVSGVYTSTATDLTVTVVY